MSKFHSEGIQKVPQWKHDKPMETHCDDDHSRHTQVVKKKNIYLRNILMLVGIISFILNYFFVCVLFRSAVM